MDSNPVEREVWKYSPLGSSAGWTIASAGRGACSSPSFVDAQAHTKMGRKRQEMRLISDVFYT
jgi:hypothetical protein